MQGTKILQQLLWGCLPGRKSGSDCGQHSAAKEISLASKMNFSGM